MTHGDVEAWPVLQRHEQCFEGSYIYTIHISFTPCSRAFYAHARDRCVSMKQDIPNGTVAQHQPKPANVMHDNKLKMLAHEWWREKGVTRIIGNCRADAPAASSEGADKLGGTSEYIHICRASNEPVARFSGIPATWL
jgi:hypothetical protein